MTVRYTTRLLALELPGGKFQVRFGLIGPNDRAVVVTGPGVVAPSLPPLTVDGLAAWMARMAADRWGIELLAPGAAAGLPLAEAEEVAEEVPAIKNVRPLPHPNALAAPAMNN